MAAGMTAAVTVALTVYAFTTKTDFTIMGGLCFIISAAFACLIIFSWFMTFKVFWHPLVTCLLIVIYGLYLIYDTQLIAGGK